MAIAACPVGAAPHRTRGPTIPPGVGRCRRPVREKDCRRDPRAGGRMGRWPLPRRGSADPQPRKPPLPQAPTLGPRTRRCAPPGGPPPARGNRRAHRCAAQARRSGRTRFPLVGAAAAGGGVVRVTPCRCPRRRPPAPAAQSPPCSPGPRRFGVRPRRGRERPRSRRPPPAAARRPGTPCRSAISVRGRSLASISVRWRRRSSSMVGSSSLRAGGVRTNAPGARRIESGSSAPAPDRRAVLATAPVRRGGPSPRGWAGPVAEGPTSRPATGDQAGVCWCWTSRHRPPERR